MVLNEIPKGECVAIRVEITHTILKFKRGTVEKIHHQL